MVLTDSGVAAANGLTATTTAMAQRTLSHSRESSTSSAASSSGASSCDDSEPPVVYIKESAASILLEARLEETRMELERSKAECGRLAQIRDDVEAEVRELTASLFQEAHIMVNAANVKAAASEKALKEARMQVEVLSAEVDALKTLVLTSTPSQPNAHLHPQLSSSLSSNNLMGSKGSSGGLKMFNRHRRGASDCDLKYPTPIETLSSTILDHHSSSDPSGPPAAETVEEKEVDPVLYKELEAWRRNPSLDKKSSALMTRLWNEDADRCLDFPCGDDELIARVRRAVEDNSIYIEEVVPPPGNNSETICALLNTPRLCRYRIKLGDGSDAVWHPISTLCRNRITAVCDMLTYLRYIQLGLVKSPINDIYWEVIRLRKQMTLARLGLS